MFISNEIKSFSNINFENSQDIVSFLDILFCLHEKKSRTSLDKFILSGFCIKANGDKIRVISYIKKENFYDHLINKNNISFEMEDLDKDLIIRYNNDKGNNIAFKIYCINPSFRKNVDENTSKDELMNNLIHLPNIKFHQRMFNNYLKDNKVLM